MQECVPYVLHKTKEINTTEGVYDECQVDPAIANTDTIYETQPEKFFYAQNHYLLLFNVVASIIDHTTNNKHSTINNHNNNQTTNNQYMLCIDEP